MCSYRHTVQEKLVKSRYKKEPKKKKTEPRRAINTIRRQSKNWGKTKKSSMTTSKRAKKSQTKKGSKSVLSQEEYFCIYCNKQFVDPPTTTWIMCRICEKWCHETCAPVEPGVNYFQCDLFVL